MMRKVHSEEVHYIVSMGEIMDKCKIPNTKKTDYIGVEVSEEFITFKQIESVN